MNNEQIEHILDGAPDGATHFDGKTYFRFEMYEHGQAYLILRNNVWQRGTPSYPVYYCSSISDLREILELRQEVERLKLERDSVCHLNDDLSAELNQLLEKCNGS